VSDRNDRHPLEEELLELLLDADPAREERLEALRRDPRTAESAAELEGFLGRCREICAADERRYPPARARALAQGVIDRTTREDLGWRGDLRLLRGFLAERLRSSMVVRVAAASLLVHVVAVPVIAWMALLPDEEPQPGLDRVSIEKPLPDWPEAPEEPRIETVELPPEDFEEDLLAERWEIANALRRGRYVLTHGGIPPLAQGAEPHADDPWAARLLHLRSRTESPLPAPEEVPAVARLAALEEGDAPEPGLSDGELLEALLWLELALDRAALGRSPGAELGAIARALCRAEVLGAVSERGEALRLLLRLGLERARQYGALGRECPGFEALPAIDRSARPVDEAWQAALGAALNDLGLAGYPACRGWLDWIPAGPR